jgi:uncharacterized protein
VEITLLPSHDRQVIQGYGGGGFKVSDRDWFGPVIVFPTRTVAWSVVSAATFTVDQFEPIRDAESPPIELLLIGAGAKMVLLPARLRADLRAFGFAVEVMDTGAACRTYNVLIGEERRVAAALLPVG